jgi:hypothetical protein
MNPIEELNVLRFAADAYRADLKSKFGDSDLITAIADDILRRCDRIQSAIFLAMERRDGFSPDQRACE